VKYENGDLFTDSHNILNSLKNYFYQLLTVHSFSELRQIEIHAAGPSHLEVEIAISNYNSPDSD
jgi:hypothetical protein